MVPVALDQELPAVGAEGTAPNAIVNIAYIDEFEAGLQRNFARPFESGMRRTRFVEHLPIRVKGGEMKRNGFSQVFQNPLTFSPHLDLRVVLTRNQKRRDFKPCFGFALKI